MLSIGSVRLTHLLGLGHVERMPHGDNTRRDVTDSHSQGTPNQRRLVPKTFRGERLRAESHCLQIRGLDMTTTCNAMVSVAESASGIVRWTEEWMALDGHPFWVVVTTR